MDDNFSVREAESVVAEAPTIEVNEDLKEGVGSRLLTALKETAETILLALVIFLLVRACIQNFKVDGSSMDPSLRTGQYLLVNKLSYLRIDLAGLSRPIAPLGGKLEGVVTPFGTPSRGDVIVFHFPRDPSRDFIKRVIGLPGETVEVRAGRVLIDNIPLEEPYILHDPTYSREPTVVPEDNYFVLGDNRNNSSDSHVWGPVPVENIVGKAWLSYWPKDQWGLAPNHKVEAIAK